ncbi:hypothetical protein Bbelb_062360 [Branchiostoma belcheri]|nr:hypothetical protein Bbelb_062360 [Branchiostoma belcheri]
MLRAVLNKTWQQHPTKEELYGDIPAVSELIRQRRTGFAGHVYRNKAELASELILWEPKQGHSKPGRPRMTYIDLLAADVGLPKEFLASAMTDKVDWREREGVYIPTSVRITGNHLFGL